MQEWWPLFFSFTDKRTKWVGRKGGKQKENKKFFFPFLPPNSFERERKNKNEDKERKQKLLRSFCSSFAITLLPLTVKQHSNAHTRSAVLYVNICIHSL
ncbi:hypothetical protein WN944_019666 [Citrus x changshan-huyou]|uniref:Uncharacterized protein n=1 Tax=Citrus x changshan-huyou TaxID=2935761 RepID=A0AAP0LVX7_9ROSI